MADPNDPNSFNWLQSLPGGQNSWLTSPTAAPIFPNPLGPTPSGVTMPGIGGLFSPKDTLPSTNIGVGGGPGTPGGTAGSDMTPGGGTSGNPASAAGAIAPLLFSLFGSSNPAAGNASANTGQLSTLAQSLFGSGQNFLGAGNQALTPVLQYLKAVAGGDPGALLGATQPQRARVIDQYDTAKRGDQFLPRGGGQVSSTMARSTKEASDLSTISADARTAGVGQLGTLGQNLSQLGVSASSQGLNALNSSITDYENQAAFAAKQNQQTGAAIGSAVSAALPFLLAL